MTDLKRTLPLAASSSYVATQDAFLRANSVAYEWIVEKIQTMERRENAQPVLSLIQEAARFAMEFHPGRFADGAVENVAFEAGMRRDILAAEAGDITIPVFRRKSSRKVLHVVSAVLGIGGLTRMLCHWVRNDRTCCHSLLLVNQKNTPIPKWLSEAIWISGGDLVVIPAESPFCYKAGWVRGVARQGPDLIVLHHCGFDMVPTMAFSVPECPPVTVVNHADHQFWLGSSVSDLVINLRTEGSRFAAQRRFVSSNAVLPVPLEIQSGMVSRHHARISLGIPQDQVVLLSVGRAEKYRPCGPYDFAATAGKILDRSPQAHLYVVGESPRGISPYLRSELHERLHFVGNMEDSSLYRAAADAYLESFPFGSQTALLEAALSGLPVVPAYAPLFPLLVTNDDAIQDLIPNPKDENEYIERVELLIHNTERRAEFGEMLRTRLLAEHVGEGWLARLAAIYKETDRSTHGPRPIPISHCNIGGEDIGLSLWHVMADGKSFSTGAPADDAKAVIYHTVFVVKDVGNYSAARRYAWSLLWRDPLAWPSWRLMAVSLIGGAGGYIMRALRELGKERPLRCVNNRLRYPKP
jgi:glycosyltransferase involved in cell wall biosynthesis